MSDPKNDVVILDFETTGLSPNYDRVIEVGAAIVKDGKIKSSFSSLCNPGYSVPHYITELTGITNAMLKDQPQPEEVMEQLYSYIGERPILAHNASFDSKFLHAEMERIGYSITNPILCTMLLSRRLITKAYNHKLGTLKEYIQYQEQKGHKDHRALDDVKVTAALWLHLQDHVESHCNHSDITFHDYQKLSKVSKNKVKNMLEKLSKPALTSSSI